MKSKENRYEVAMLEGRPGRYRLRTDYGNLKMTITPYED